MKKKNLIHFAKTHKVRLALCGVMVMALYVTPELTQAQYKWTLNGYNIVRAGEFYFDGNYLHDTSKNSYYASNGWDGNSELTMDKIEIRNYENALLANKDGEDLRYLMSWGVEVIGTNGRPNGKSCSISVAQNSDSTQEEGDSVIIDQVNRVATGFMKGTGNPKKQTYSVTVTPPTGELEAGESVVITMNAENITTTDEDHTITTSFHRSIKATFKYTVSTADTYVKSFDPQDAADSDEVHLKIGTGAIPDMNAKAQTVYVWWKADSLEINPFNMDFSVASSQKQGYIKPEDNPYPGYGIVKFTEMGSNAIRNLDFYKLGDTANKQWFADNALTAWNTKPDEANGAILGFYLEDQTGTTGQ